MFLSDVSDGTVFLTIAALLIMAILIATVMGKKGA
jgi:hypothetical protein